MSVKKKVVLQIFALAAWIIGIWWAKVYGQWLRLIWFVGLAAFLIVAFLHSIIQPRRDQHPGASADGGRDEKDEQDDARSEPRPPTARW